MGGERRAVRGGLEDPWAWGCGERGSRQGRRGRRGALLAGVGGEGLPDGGVEGDPELPFLDVVVALPDAPDALARLLAEQVELHDVVEGFGIHEGEALDAARGRGGEAAAGEGAQRRAPPGGARERAEHGLGALALWRGNLMRAFSCFLRDATPAAHSRAEAFRASE